MSLVSAIIALGALIFVHELGHFLVAKLAGVGVETFSLGFGPRLVGIKRGETDYRISAIPLGGFVRMVGEHPGDEVSPEDLPRSFSHKPLGWRVAIVAAGPAANVLLALLIYYFVLVTWGIPNLTTMVGDVLPDQPAKQAGMQKGDLVRAINGKPVVYWTDMVAAIQQNQTRPMHMVLERAGQAVEVSINPREVVVKDIFNEEHRVFRIGIRASHQMVVREVGFLEAVDWALRKTYLAGELIAVSVIKLVQRKVSMDNLGGPILIAQAASEAASQGLPPLLDLTALISVNLAVLNLLPIPALDGGHLFFFLLEAIRRKPVSRSTRDKAQQVGMALLLLLMLVIFYNDIARIVAGGSQ
ncbi:MAG: RIP metalloprotease RseP [Desulfarculaceae bacterium]|jgi:regulator of sigma E protease